MILHSYENPTPILDDHLLTRKPETSFVYIPRHARHVFKFKIKVEAERWNSASTRLRGAAQATLWVSAYKSQRTKEPHSNRSTS